METNKLTRLQIHTLNMYHFVYRNNGCTDAPESQVILTLSLVISVIGTGHIEWFSHRAALPRSHHNSKGIYHIVERGSVGRRPHRVSSAILSHVSFPK
jgi:hypothetical protein